MMMHINEKRPIHKSDFLADSAENYKKNCNIKCGNIVKKFYHNFTFFHKIMGLFNHKSRGTEYDRPINPTDAHYYTGSSQARDISP